jgi:2-methylcitrate dehydratase
MLNPALEVEDPTNTVSLVVALADYAASFPINSDSAIETARRSLMDAFGRGFEALRDPECASLISPLVPGAVMPGGARVPGTSLELDPAQAAFCTGLMLCRSGSANPWLALRSGHAPDSLGAILAVADYQARKATMEGKSPPKVRDVLAAIVKALEIQGVLAFEGGSDELETGFETIRLARVAAAAIVTAQLGGTLGQIVIAVSHACIDGGMLIQGAERYDIGRRSWAMADAISRAVRHACQTMAAARSSYLTSVDLEAVDLAGRLLGARPSIVKKPFGTEIIDRLAGPRESEEVVQLTTRFRVAVDRYFPPRQAERVKALFAAPERLDDLPFNELLAALVTNGAR